MIGGTFAGNPYRVLGRRDDPQPLCAMSGCDQPGIARDPRPRSALSVLHGCGFFYLCREDLTRAEIEWLRDGAPTEPTPSIIPGRKPQRAGRR